MFGLASILGVKLFSVYPNKGNPNVQKDLNRLLFPRCANEKPCSPDTTFIMWTTTRMDINNPEYFVPNHFVPLVPKDCPIQPLQDAESRNEIPITLQLALTNMWSC